MFEDTRSTKKKLMGLTSALELGVDSADPKYDFMLHTAEQLKQELSHGPVELTGLEKVRIIKSMCRAKARAYARGLADDYKTYKALRTISTDLVRML